MEGGPPWESGSTDENGARSGSITSNPYFRSFAVGAVFFIAGAFRIVARHPGGWSSYPPRNFVVLVVAWLITALLLGVVATRFRSMRSWLGIGLGTMGGSMFVLSLMFFTMEQIYRPPALPKFNNTDEMMAYMAHEATKWVQQDRGLDLDYSMDSIKVIEEELGRVSMGINKANPEQGTFGMAMGYGAYIGEVFRRRDGGSWAVDHPAGGPRSYPLTTKSNSTVFPVGWCWKRLTVGEEDNVYHKALLLSQRAGSITNIAGER